MIHCLFDPKQPTIVSNEAYRNGPLGNKIECSNDVSYHLSVYIVDSVP